MSETVFQERADRQYRLLKFGVLAMIVLGCAIRTSLNGVDPDLWGHWQYGKDWLAEGELPTTASHTYTAPEHPWINHENAAELLIALGYEHLGIYALLAIKCALGTSMFVAMVWTAGRRGVHGLTAWALTLLAAHTMRAFFPLRPQLLSFMFFTVMLVCLDRAFRDWPDKLSIHFAWLWPLPPLFSLWVNSHGGFVAGLCVVGALLLGRMCELLMRRRRASVAAVCQLAIVGLACLAATFVNPYGIGMHRWLFRSLGSPRPEITEWAPILPGSPMFWPFLTLALVAAGSLFGTRRRRDWTQIVILALVGVQATLHVRHVAFFALLCGFWLPVHFQSAIWRLRPDRTATLPTVLPARWFRMTLASAIFVGLGCQGFALAKKLSNFPVSRDRYPIDAVQFMVDRQLHGKLVVSFNWAQYAIAALSPDVTVGFDGRFRTCYPQEVVDMHFDFLLGDYDGKRHRSAASGPIDQTKVLCYRDPDMVLVDRSYDNAVQVMEEQAAAADPEWTLLYRDTHAELWGRRDRYDDPASEHYLPKEARQLDATPSDVSVPWPALPARRATDEAPRAPCCSNASDACADHCPATDGDS